MKLQTKVQKLLLVCALFLFCCAGAYVYRQHIQDSIQYMHGDTIDIPLATDHFKKIISADGAQKAHTLFLSESNGLSASQGHTLAHALGSALFETLGDSAFPYCGDEFIYGCYHQFLGEAVTQNGEASIVPFFTACEKNPRTMFGCEHGIGHGIVSYVGYTRSDLDKALSLCKKYEHPEIDGPLSGCADGVFMEYDIREMAGYENSGTVVPRTFSADNPYGPCPTIDKRYTKECTFELPDWWLGWLPPGSSLEAHLQDTGSYCLGLPADQVAGCFFGTGFIVGKIENMNVKKIESDCTIAAKSRPDYMQCILGVVKRYRVLFGEDSVTACSHFTLSDSDLKSCKSFVPF